MTYWTLIAFWFGFGLGCWVYRKYTKDPTYFKTRFARLFRKDAP